MAAAQNVDSQTLDYSSAVARAVEWHPSIEEAVGRLEAQGEERDVAKAGYLPQISGGIGSTVARDGENRWRPRANISASQMIYDFGKVKSSVRSAEAGDKVVRARLLSAVDSLSRETAMAVVEVQRAQAQRQVAEQQLQDLRMIEELVRHRFTRGAATKSDALQAKGRVGGAEADIQRIDGEVARWRGTLANLTGQNDVGVVDDSVPDWLNNSCALGVGDWGEVPSIMEVMAERERAFAEYDRSKADRLPTFSIEGGASADMQEPWSDTANYNVGITVNSSLFNGGARNARARGAGYALKAATAAEARVRTDIERVIAEVQRQVESLGEVERTLAVREADMRETGSLYRLQYLEMGTRTLVDLLNAQQEYHGLRFSLVSNQHDVRRLQTECLFYSGAMRQKFGLTGKRVRGVTL
jgi:adhesin transport system outer membrane protein